MYSTAITLTVSLNNQIFFLNVFITISPLHLLMINSVSALSSKTFIQRHELIQSVWKLVNFEASK